MDSAHASPSFPPPFQHAMAAPSMTQSPTYPSPARSESSVNYSGDGLGLYNYPVPLSGGEHSNAGLYTPSPQPNDAWPPRVSTDTSPMMTESSVEAWPMYDHQVTRSPLAWNQPSYAFSSSTLVNPNHSPGLAPHSHFSHRSSVSSSNETSLYSRSGSESTLTPDVKVETPREWMNEGNVSPHSVVRQQPLTVAPDRLSNMALPYRYDHPSPTLQRYDAVPTDAYHHEARNLRSSDPQERRRSSTSSRASTSAASRRTRIRRNPTTPQNANYRCHVCNKLFQRSYNHKAHLQTHDEYREYPHKCPYHGCDRKFVRKTDYTRHEQSVHIKSKNFKCGACMAHFARRDTLRRHEEDGCPRRYEVKHHELDPLRAAISRSAGSPGAAAAAVRQGYHDPADAGSPESPFARL